MKHQSWLWIAIPFLSAPNALGATHGVVDDKDVARFLAEEEERYLQSNSDDGQGLLQRCGRRNSCADGFECTEVAIGRRCLPIDCYKTELEALNFNGMTYMGELYNKAGYSEEEVSQELASAADRKEFEKTSMHRSLMKALQKDAETRKAFQNIQTKCNYPNNDRPVRLLQGEEESDTTSSTNDYYFGIQLELGCLADVSYSYLQDFAPLGGSNWTLNRVCLGCGPQFGAQLSVVLAGAVNATSVDDLTCGSIWCDIDLLFGVGLAAGIGFNGVKYVELTLGGGLMLGGGIATCGTF
jgi:hypothetical protein